MTKIDTTQTQKIEIVNLDEQIKTKSHAWKKARELERQKIAETLTIESIYNKISVFNNPRDRCLFAILYICAARCEEIVRYTPRKWGRKKVKIIKGGEFKRNKNTNKLYHHIQDYNKKIIGDIKEGMIKEDISFENINGRRTMRFRIRNLKNKKEISKIIPLPLDNEINLKFAKIIHQYIIPLDDKEELFAIGKRRAEQILDKAGFNPHFLRKVRLTHLVKYYNFGDQKLRVFAGWSDSRPAKSYIRLNWADLVQSM